MFFKEKVKLKAFILQCFARSNVNSVGLRSHLRFNADSARVEWSVKNVIAMPTGEGKY